MRDKEEVLGWIKSSKLVPVIRAASHQEALTAIGALVDGGIDIIEVTMTVPLAVELVAEVVRQFGDIALVGAGTVYDPNTAAACINAGAEFIVGPCLDLPTVSFCNEAEVLVAAGAFTPTEVVTAWRGGADVIKVFPCDAGGGASYIKSLKAPFPEIPLMPTGGITAQNAKNYLAAGAIGLGVGGNLVNLELVREGRLEELRRLATEFRLAVR